ncbi:MAG: dTMP kinase [Sphingomicrobium sp.]
MTPRGKFVSLEGGEGAGKSTQLQAMAAALRTRGIDVIETREPGGSPGAEAIRGLLLGGSDERWTMAAEALLFAAARADHVARTIDPALDAGQWVLCDRFVDSSLAYQGLAGGLGLDALRAINALAVGKCMPDRTLILMLDAAAERARTRDGGTSDRIGARSPAYHDKVDAAFRALAADEPSRVTLVDASGPPGDVTKRLVEAIADLLP